jgi:hypothetical protein
MSGHSDLPAQSASDQTHGHGDHVPARWGAGIVKNETLGHGLRNLPWLLGWEILRLGFVVVRDRPMLGAYAEAWRALPEAKRKRALVQARARRLAAAAVSSD